MSLQVWLPLNGSTSNQGLNGLSMIGSPSSWGDGKIGKCATFNGNLIHNDTTELNYTDNFSYCLWINQNYSGAVAEYAFTVGRADSGGYGYGINILSASTIRLWFGSRTIDISCPANEWHHIAFTVSGNIIKVYKDGVLLTTSTTQTLPTYSDGKGLGLGYFHYISGDIYAYHGSLNDFRIYNHCLSAREVKEISKGLVCHYLMNQPEQSPNLSTLPSYIPDFPNGAGTSVFSRSTDGVSRRLTCTTSGDGGLYNTCFSNSVRLENTVYTWSVDIRASKNMSVYVGLEGGGEANFDVTTDWQRISKTAVLLTNTYSAFVVYPGNAAATGDWIEMKLLKVEKNNFATPWSPCPSDYPKWPDSIEYDCSGYSRNANRINSPSLSLGSPRYERSCKFTGSEYLTFPNPLTSSSTEFSISCWVKFDNTSDTMAICTMRSSVGNGIALFRLDSNTFRFDDNSKTLFSDYSVPASTWLHLVVTRSSSSKNLYINGNLIQSVTSVGDMRELYSTGSIGASSASGSGLGNFLKGELSDFRVYSTALSASDIKELYSTSASIDKNGNMYAYEFKEE